MTNIVADLECQPRELKTGGHLKQLRKTGMVPAIIYSKGKAAMPVTVNATVLSKLSQQRGTRGLFTIQVPGEAIAAPALLREIQVEPMTGAYVHLDLMRIDMDELMRASVPVIIIGDNEAEVRTGGTVQIGLKEIEVQCLPGVLPENIHLEISKGEINSKYRARDLPLPYGVVLITDPEGLLAVILPPKVDKEKPVED
ncbi:MAG: 50S ribosomal protein L25 [Ignavibacteriales bacterium]